MTQEKKHPVEFIWQGTNQDHHATSGKILAPNLVHARVLLKQQGINTTKIRRKPTPLLLRKRTISAKDINIVSRQMATMIGAGIPIAQTLRSIGNGHDNNAVQTLMMELSHRIESGSPLSSALRKHSRYFTPLFTSLIAAGETSGKLDIMLNRGACYNETLATIKNKVTSALVYPAVVLVITIAVILIILLFVIPQFEALFHGFAAELPALTRVTVALSRWVQSQWHLCLAIMALIAVSIGFIYRLSANLRYQIDRQSLRIPVVGAIIEKSILARFSRTLATVFGAGVPLAQSIHTIAMTTDNRAFQRAMLTVQNDINTGLSLEKSMAKTKVVPNMMLQMLASGEESGKLELMLDKVAEFYEQEVNASVDALSSLIEPIMIVVLGVIIGTIVLAMYLPIFNMAAVF